MSIIMEYQAVTGMKMNTAHSWTVFGNNCLSNKTWHRTTISAVIKNIHGFLIEYPSYSPSMHPSVHPSIPPLFTTSGVTLHCNNHGNNKKKYIYTLISIPHTHPLLEDGIFHSQSNHILPGEDYQPPPAAPPQHLPVSLPLLACNISHLLRLSFFLSLSTFDLCKTLIGPNL